MTKNRLLKAILLCPLFMLIMQHAWAQNKSITGKVSDEKGSAVAGVSVTAKGTKIGAFSDAGGNFKISVPESAKTLVFSSVGFTTQEVDISGKSEINVTLSSSVSNLTDVVVVGYGTSRKKDLTGSVVSVKAKDFNQGIVTAPDQLIQGKVAGLQVVNNSGAPGGGTTVRIRGNSSVRSGSQPLYVIDGVPLDGRSADPGLSTAIGTSPGSNPLNFINPNDIASVDVLKDASATAIFGSRGSNGVILITTKKGKAGAAKIDFATSVGFSNILKKLDILTGDEYRAALTDYGLNSGNFGSSVDAIDAISHTGITQNYSLGIGGGNENGNYRVGIGLQDIDGVIKKSGFKKYTINVNGQYKFLESKKLMIDYALFATQNTLQTAPISNDAGFTGSIIGQALQWNPTHPLYNPDGSIWIVDPALGNTTINPLAMQAAYDDVSNVTTLLGYIAPSYKITDNLTYKMVFSINRGVGVRRAQTASFLNLQGVENRGAANFSTNELTTQQYTHTLSYNKQVTSSVFLDALAGYEYLKFANKGVGVSALDFVTDYIPYTNILQNSSQGSRGLNSFEDPTSELQSFFGRVNANISDKYLLTATVRADGSSKFGKNNKYGVFPSFAAAWNISKESFMSGGVFNNLKLRAGWGQTGNQEFPAGAAQERYALLPGGTGAGPIALANVANPDLKWETSTTFNGGFDFGILQDKIYGSIEYFNKKTTDLLFNFSTIQPAPAGRYWVNLPGNVVNSGAEISLNTVLVSNKKIDWTFGVNAAFLHNELNGYTGPTILTGGLHGQGISGTTVQRLENGQPLNVFYVRDWQGIDKTTGQSIYADGGNSFYYLGDPNPDVLLGISTNFNYDKLSVGINLNGAFGQQIYNNTANTVTPIGNLGSRNISASVLEGKPATSDAIKASDRYLEDGSYLKLANATVSYDLGTVAKIAKNARVFITGQNLFIITKFTGFDPEVNTDKNIDGVASFGIEYTPYPTPRSIIFGLNFSF